MTSSTVTATGMRTSTATTLTTGAKTATASVTIMATSNQQKQQLVQQSQKKLQRRVGGGVSSLMYACQQGDVDQVRRLLRVQVSRSPINKAKRNEPSAVVDRDRTGKTALHYCATSDRQKGATQAADVVAMAAPELIDGRDVDGFTPLHLAVIAGNMPLVTFLLANRADVEAIDNEKHTVVHWATVCGEMAALNAVLSVGAPVSTPDVHGGYPLHYAAQMCGAATERDANLGLQVLTTLLSHPSIDVNVVDGDGRQPLLWAASAGSSRATLALIRAGARSDASDNDGLTALHCAASRGHVDCIDALLTLCGADVDCIDNNGCTALHYAVTLGHADATALLLTHGADANRRDRKGRTAAHCGCAKAQFETVKLLSDRGGGDLWLRNARGDLPLHEATASGRRDLVRWLIEMRPSRVTATNNDGRTALHLAALNDNVDMCKILLDSGADVNPVLRTTKNALMTPLDCALRRGHRNAAKFLQLHGGRPASRLLLQNGIGLHQQDHQQPDREQNQQRPAIESLEQEILISRSSGDVNKRPKRRMAPKLMYKKEITVTGSRRKTNSKEAADVGSKEEKETVAAEGKVSPPGGDSSDATSTTTSEAADDEVVDEVKHKRRRRRRDLVVKASIHLEPLTKTSLAKVLNEGDGEKAVLPPSPAINSSAPAAPIADDLVQKVVDMSREELRTFVDAEKEAIARLIADAETKLTRTVGGSETIDVNPVIPDPLARKQVDGEEERRTEEKAQEEVVMAEQPEDKRKAEESRQEANEVETHRSNDEVTATKCGPDVEVESNRVQNESDRLTIQNAKLVETEMKVETATVGETTALKETAIGEEAADLKQEIGDKTTAAEADGENNKAAEEDGGNVKAAEDEDGNIGKTAEKNESIDRGEGESGKTDKIEGETKKEKEPELKEDVPPEIAEKAEDEEETNGRMPETKSKSSQDRDEINEGKHEIDRRNCEEEQSNDNREAFEDKPAEETVGKIVESTVTMPIVDRESQKPDGPIKNDQEVDGGNQPSINTNITLQKPNQQRSETVNDGTEKPEERGDIDESKKKSDGNKKPTNDVTEPSKKSQRSRTTTTKKKKPKTASAKIHKKEGKTGEQLIENGENLTKKNEKSTKNRRNLVTKNDNLLKRGENLAKRDENVAKKGEDVTKRTAKPSRKHRGFTVIETLTDAQLGVDASNASPREDVFDKTLKKRREIDEIARHGRVKQLENSLTETEMTTSASASTTPSSSTASVSEEETESYAKRDRKRSFTVIEPLPNLVAPPSTTNTIAGERRSVSNMSAPLLARDYYTDTEDEERDEKDEAAIDGDEETVPRSRRFAHRQPVNGVSRRRKRQNRFVRRRESRSAGSDYDKIDSGFEPSPRATITRIPVRSNDEDAHRHVSDRGVNMTSVTQTIQSNIRRYHMERKIFQHLLDLKRLQIRSGRHNETVLVKRAIDAYHRSCASTVGAGRYDTGNVDDLTFKNFERFLYDALRKLQRQNGVPVGYLRGLPDDATAANPLLCTQSTHRCMHATHAYTGVPCAAYLPKMDHHTIPKIGFDECKPYGGSGGFLPKIVAAASNASGSRLKKKKVTLEFNDGMEKKIVALPTDRLDQNKRYYVTFTVKGGGTDEDSRQKLIDDDGCRALDGEEVGHKHPASD